MLSAQLSSGLVVASYGKRYGVELDDGRQISCVTRGKKTDLACGDRVGIKLTDSNEGVVEKLEPRHSLLYRSNSFRSKMLASNVTQVVIVLATTPSFYEELLNRCLIAAEAAGIRAVIVLNKCDIGDNSDALERLQDYAKLGYIIQPLSAKQDISPLRPWLQEQTSVLVGQSGMGKSTIVNALLPGQQVRTQEVSTVLDSGKHTTTAAHLYHLDAHSQLIDSPGLQEFGLHHLSADQLEHAFIEFRPFLGKCRFNNCRHLKEPDCALQQAVIDSHIPARRLGYYQQLRQEMQ
ncbi:ribosome small subunit-dependent GTPase A [Methylobacillus caricis]|nr:ribosome small subunit-dependent GTPase A [Methylobacillus caricis]MCB5187329.1 ribosome small subunit-dependent GTPase A [Methylobacillus caricis]